MTANQCAPDSSSNTQTSADPNPVPFDRELLLALATKELERKIMQVTFCFVARVFVPMHLTILFEIML